MSASDWSSDSIVTIAEDRFSADRDKYKRGKSPWTKPSTSVLVSVSFATTVDRDAIIHRLHYERETQRVENSNDEPVSLERFLHSLEKKPFLDYREVDMASRHGANLPSTNKTK